MRRFVKYLSTGLACAALIVAAAHAADYPQRSVQINVGASPGGTTDALARLMGQKLAEKWGQPVVVVNRPGADHRIAAEFVAGAKPDGYNIFMMVNDIVLPDPPGVKVTYDPVKSFTHAALLAQVPNCLVVKGDFPVNSLQDLTAMAKAQPNKLNISVVGTGALAEVAMRRFLVLTKTRMEFLHYQGSSPGLVAVLGGEAQMTHLPCSNVISHLQNNELKILAITQKSTLPALASVPTFEDASGVKGFDGGGSNWYGMSVPAGTPDAVVAKIRHDALEVLDLPDVKKFMANQFIFPATGVSQKDFADMIRTDITRWAAWSKETESMAK